MQDHLTGNDVRCIRQAFGLSIDQFARAIAVHPVTLNRWELEGDRRLRIDGAPGHILTGLRNRLLDSGRLRPRMRSEVKGQGEELAALVAVGAVLAALAIVVAIASSGKK